MDHLLSLWSEEDSSLFRSFITWRRPSTPPFGLRRSFPALPWLLFQILRFQQLNSILVPNLAFPVSRELWVARRLVFPEKTSQRTKGRAAEQRRDHGGRGVHGVRPGWRVHGRRVRTGGVRVWRRAGNEPPEPKPTRRRSTRAEPTFG